MRLTRRQKKLATVAFVAGSLSAAGFLATSAQAGPCIGSSTTHCDDPTRDVEDAVGSVSVRVGSQVKQAGAAADGAWNRARAIARSNRAPDPGAVSVPTLSGPLPPVGPVGPSPVGDGLRAAEETIDGAFVAYERAVNRLPNGGEVSVPTVSGPLPPIGPVGPGPVGDGLHKAIKPVLGGGKDAPAVKAR